MARREDGDGMAPGERAAAWWRAKYGQSAPAASAPSSKPCAALPKALAQNLAAAEHARREPADIRLRPQWKPSALAARAAIFDSGPAGRRLFRRINRALESLGGSPLEALVARSGDREGLRTDRYRCAPGVVRVRGEGDAWHAFVEWITDPYGERVLVVLRVAEGV